jgi:hypothetical protein
MCVVGHLELQFQIAMSNAWLSVHFRHKSNLLFPFYKMLYSRRPLLMPLQWTIRCFLCTERKSNSFSLSIRLFLYDRVWGISTIQSRAVQGWFGTPRCNLTGAEPLITVSRIHMYIWRLDDIKKYATTVYVRTVPERSLITFYFLGTSESSIGTHHSTSTAIYSSNLSQN